MKITKPDFKIIFNKILNKSNQENLNLLQNISNNSISGDSQIDQLIGNYSSEYISKIINKILNNNLIGGQTSEEEPKQNSSLFNLGLSETSIKPPKFVNIVDMTGGIFPYIPIQSSQTPYKASTNSNLMTLSHLQSLISNRPLSPTLERSLSPTLERPLSPTLERPLSSTLERPLSPTQDKMSPLFLNNYRNSRPSSPLSSTSSDNMEVINHRLPYNLKENNMEAKLNAKQNELNALEQKLKALENRISVRNQRFL